MGQRKEGNPVCKPNASTANIFLTKFPKYSLRKNKQSANYAGKTVCLVAEY